MISRAFHLRYRSLATGKRFLLFLRQTGFASVWPLHFYRRFILNSFRGLADNCQVHALHLGDLAKARTVNNSNNEYRFQRREATYELRSV